MKNCSRNGPLQTDEAVILLDRKDREYLARLDQRATISIRGVFHASIEGTAESVVAMRPK